MSFDTDAWHREYHPCENGVHIFQPEGGKFGGLTLRNYPGASLDAARALTSAGEGDDFDLLCDLFVNGDWEDSVPIRRQDLDLIDRALQETTDGK